MHESYQNPLCKQKQLEEVTCKWRHLHLGFLKASIITAARAMVIKTILAATNIWYATEGLCVTPQFFFNKIQFYVPALP